MHPSQRLINHVALVLDGSSSMSYHKNSLVKVADEQIRHLALRSEELQQETRVSVYLFADRVNCLIFDMDVMRLPSIADLYKIGGMTALVDASIKSQEDLATTSQLYGDHAFLTFVLTDGQENRSRNSFITLSHLIAKADENWTMAFLVPDSSGVAYMSRTGVPTGNIAQWDATSAKGIVDVGSTVRNATDNFMASRATGVRGSRSIFSTGPEAVNRQTVTQNLQPLDKSKYVFGEVHNKSRIDDFVNYSVGIAYRPGIAYYELTKTETIQPQKEIMVMDKMTKRVYAGASARNMIGLPDRTTRVKPDYNPDFTIFVQSTSLNRNLVPGTDVLVVR